MGVYYNVLPMSCYNALSLPGPGLDPRKNVYDSFGNVNHNVIVISKPSFSKILGQISKYARNANYKHIGIGIGIFSMGCYLVYRFSRIVRNFMNKKIHALKSKLINYSRITNLNVPIDQLRTTFRNTPYPRINPTNKTHSHPMSAAWRSATSGFARSIAGLCGLKVFSEQASNKDIRDGLDYGRSYYWDKDVTVAVNASKPGPNHLPMLVDVDYYMDMQDYLVHNNQPVLIYTFQPTKVSDSNCGDFSFKFVENNEVEYSVAGSAHYKHQVWNYQHDTITVNDWWTTKTYLLERRKANEHHEYVFAIPIGTWNGVWAYIARTLSSNRLGRLCVNQDQFNVLDVHTVNEGLFKSVGRIGDYNSTYVSIKKFESLVANQRHGGTKIGTQAIMSRMDGDFEQSSVLLDYLRSSVSRTQAMSVYPVSEGIRNYQITSSYTTYEPDVKPLLAGYMSPIIPGCFVPDDSKNNDMASIEGRIIVPQLDAKALVDANNNPNLLKYMIEFVELLIPVPNIGVPFSVEDVYEKQKTPTQRALLLQSDTALPIRNVKSFLKAEAYGKPADPRMISTYNTCDKLQYSRYIYSFSEYIIDTQDWYAFGRNPSEIADTVAAICVTSNLGVNAADANRMDGHVFTPLRTLESMILARYFSKEYLPLVSDLHKSQFNIKAKTKNNVKYVIEEQRGSGSAETAIFNSIASKFNDYSGRRSFGNCPRVAYNALGIFGGDDTFASQFSEAVIGGSYIKIAGKELGQDIDNVEFVHGSAGVNFLSRFFTRDVWNGSPDSTCDMKRILSKIHATVSLDNYSPIQKLNQKLIGLNLTDMNTPVLREIIIAAKRLGMKFSIPADLRLQSWWARFDVEVNWPNDVNSDVLFDHLPLAEVSTLFDYLSKATKLEDLLSMPCIMTVDDIPVEYKHNLVAIDDTFVHKHLEPSNGTYSVTLTNAEKESLSTIIENMNPDPNADVILSPPPSPINKSKVYPILPVPNPLLSVTVPQHPFEIPINQNKWIQGRVQAKVKRKETLHAHVYNPPDNIGTTTTTITSSTKAPVIKSHEVCPGFLEGNCFSKKCGKPHMKICKEFQAGKCKRDPGKCKYLH